MGVLVSMMTGNSITYGLEAVSMRGPLFIGAGIKVYEGMIVGEHVKDNDVIVNPCKPRRLSNMRSAGADLASSIPPPRTFSLEDALEYIEADEYVEVTPKTIRLRKKMLRFKERKKAGDRTIEEEGEEGEE
jgi:GTP-binding protein